MEKFIAKFGHQLSGVLKGWDRLVLSGELRVQYATDGGMQQFLKSNGVLLKDFREYVQNTSKRLKEASLAEARQQQRPIVYMRSPKGSKEEQPARFSNGTESTRG